MDIESLGGTGVPGTGIRLQSLDLIQSVVDPSLPISKGEIIGLVAGGLAGWIIANKFSLSAVKYIGAIVGAELGILIARLVKR